MSKKKIKKKLAKRVDTKDRKKIKDRTRPIPNLATYDHRLHLVHESAAVGETFSFLVLGDAGAGGRRRSGAKGEDARPKFLVAQLMNDNEPKFDFILHLGDVVYLSGSKEGYPDRVIGPYHYWLEDGTDHEYDDMVFTKPFLPVYGNHDYFDLPRALPGLGRVIGALKDSIGSGSENGKVFERAFVDKKSAPTGGVLPYVTHERTRIPNRYYWFTHGPCAFIALDSNTLDAVEKPSREQREDLKEKLEKAEYYAGKLMEQIEGYEDLIERKKVDPEDVEVSLYVLVSALGEEEKEIAMLEKYLDVSEQDYDKAQLAWLEHVLQHDDVRDKWKIVYMHHPLYSSESSHTNDPESDGLRANLRRLFVDHGVHLVLSGHSHCFEWLMRATSTEEAPDEEARLAQEERRICYIGSGGGGRELRESILERDASNQNVLKQQRQFLDVAESKAYSALFQKGREGDHHHMFHYLRVEVSPDHLKVMPVGMLELLEDKPFKQSPIRIKTFNPSGIGFETDDSKLLNCINVFRNRPPEAEF